MNRVILSGHVQNTPIKFVINNTQVIRFCLRTVSKWTTEYHNIAIWGKNDIVNTIKIGMEVLVEGEIRHRKYNDKYGAPKEITEIVANIGSGNSIEVLQLLCETTDSEKKKEDTVSDAIIDRGNSSNIVGNGDAARNDLIYNDPAISEMHGSSKVGTITNNNDITNNL